MANALIQCVRRTQIGWITGCEGALALLSMLAMTLPKNDVTGESDGKSSGPQGADPMVKDELLRHLVLLHHGVLLVHHTVGLLHLVGCFGHCVSLLVHFVGLLHLAVLHRRLHGVFGEGRRSESQTGRKHRGKKRLHGSPSLDLAEHCLAIRALTYARIRFPLTDFIAISRL